MNLPNKLSILRIALIPVMVALFYLTVIPYNYLWSAVVFVLSALTDFLDGYIARKYNLITDLGKFLDPIADKILVLSAFVIMLTVKTSFGGDISELLYQLTGGIGVTLIIARELSVSVLRMVAASKNRVLAADKTGKVKTFITDIAVVLLLLALEFTVLSWAAVICFIVAVVLTVISGASYLIKNKDVLK